jgi:hypothetical protein
MALNEKARVFLQGVQQGFFLSSFAFRLEEIPYDPSQSTRLAKINGSIKIKDPDCLNFLPQMPNFVSINL